jgi:phenylacetate-CoA ligase
LQKELIKHILYPGFQRLKGRNTMALLDEWESVHLRAPEELQDYQMERLRSAVIHAAEHVPYYRNRWADRGISPGVIQDPAVVNQLPLTDKSTVRKYQESFLADDRPYSTAPVKTGGSTGEPLHYFMGQDAFAGNQAAIWRSRGWWGLEPGQPNILLWGHSAALQRGWQGQLARFSRPVKDWLLNRRTFSAYDLSPEALNRYWKAARRHKPVFIRGYTSSLYFWSQYLLDQGWAVQVWDELKAVIVTSEVLYDWQRTSIEQAFGCPVVNEYGANEAGMIAYSCPEGSLHLMDENLYVELVPLDDTGQEGFGEVVITQLHHRAAPLIRYRMGDIAREISRGCACGSHLRVLEGLQGRAHDLIITPEGKTVHAQLFVHLFKYVEGARRFQILQENQDLILIRILLEEGFHQVEEKTLIDNLKEYVSPRIDFRIEYPRKISAEESGKFRFVISRARKPFQKERTH